MWNALTRFSDHEGTIRMTEGRKQEGSSEEMIRLENNLYGNSATFKTNELNALRELIAA
jgi:hypothetical protein